MSDPEWLTISDSAAMVGLSRTGFIEFAGREGVEIRQRGGHPGVRLSQLKAAIDHARLVKPLPPDLADIEFLGLTAAAELVGVAHGTVLRAVHNGTLRAIRSGPKW